MEEKATKRYLIILLCAVLLCTCGVGMAEGGASSAEEGETLTEESQVPSEEGEEPSGEGEEPSAHDESHHTVEQEHGEPSVEKTDSLETHTWVTSFDLYCEECGRVIEENVRTEQREEPHAWDVTREEPTCVSEGSEISVCTVCGAEKMEVLPKLDHVYADEALLEGRDAGKVTGTGDYSGLVIGKVVTAPTCTENGEGMLLCLLCQTAVRKTALPAKGHEWDEWADVPIPEDEICVTEKIEQRQCLVCGETETQIAAPAPGHQWLETITKEPTCTETGEAVRECEVCHAKEEALIPAKGHEWSEWTEVPKLEDEICVTEVTEQRQCGVCGETETRVKGPAPGHQWLETVTKEPTCTEIGKKERECEVCHIKEEETLPALGHIFGNVTGFVKHEAGTVMGSDEYEGLILGEVIEPSTCTENGSGVLLCLRCQQAQRNIVIPMGDHNWSDWEQQEIPEDLICVTDMIGVRRCLDCGLEETEVLAPAPGHQWIGVSFTEPTCTEPGEAVRRCAVCQTEEIIESPALGHCFMWMDVKQPNGNTISQNICTVCGLVADEKAKTPVQMYYNNTITSFGPMTRDLIGGSVWNRITPLNLEEEGMFTYPLVASNRFTVGTATVINEKGTQTVSYKLNSKKFTVHTQTLVIYPDLEALRTGENAVVLEFDQPTELKEYFGEDQLVLMAITLKADYDAMDPGIQNFIEDRELIAAMTELIE